MRGKRRALAEGCVLKATRLRVYPNAAQRQILPTLFGHARFVWNWALARQKEHLKSGEQLESGYGLQKELTTLKREKEWLHEVPISALQTKLHDLDQALTNCFEGRAGFPKFKSKYKPQSVRITLDKRHQMKCFAWTCGIPMLPKLGALKVKGRALPDAMPDSVTLSRDGLGQVWLSFTAEERIEPLPLPAVASVGGDLGIETLLTLSNAVEIENPRFWKTEQKRVKKLQKRLARQVKGSARWRETKRRLAKLCARIANRRRDFLHKLSRWLVERYGIICLESLFIKGMSASARGTMEKPGKNVRQKAGLNRSLLDAALGELARLVRYKAQWYARTCVEVDRWFPSSKLCSTCGAKAQGLKLHHRHWTCCSCASTHQRDHNAAVNIEAEGLRLWYAVPEAPGRGEGAGTAPPSCAPLAGTPSGGEGYPSAASSCVSANPNGGLHACLEHA